jgi:DNA-binding CsgD family transcriptional regulator
LNYSTLFLTLLTLSCGGYALAVIRRAFSTYSVAYLRFFFLRLSADLTLTLTVSILYLAGMPLRSAASWSHGITLLMLLFVLGIICVFVATEAQVATVLSLMSTPWRRRFSVCYLVLLLGIAGEAGMAVRSGLAPVAEIADRSMLVFAVLSRLLALCVAAALIIRSRSRGTKATRKATLLAGCYFVAIDGSWLALYALGSMGLLHAPLYEGLHLTRMLVLVAVVVVYLSRFLDTFEGSRALVGAGDKLDRHLVKKYGITRREEEIIQKLRQGRSNEEIAQQLFIATPTVKGHLYRIFQKTRVKNRVQLAALFGTRAEDTELPAARKGHSSQQQASE